MNPILTIMIPTTVDRFPLFNILSAELFKQINQLPDPRSVRVISLEDNKEMSVGAKRQKLLETATGDFVVGIDSDDWIDNCYIMEILNVIHRHPTTDHVGFLEHCDIDGEQSISIFSSADLEWAENKRGYDHIRCANPKSVIRRSVALRVGFEDMRYGEDRVFSEKVTPLIKSEVFIHKVLYYYRHISTPHAERYGIKQ